MGEKEQISEEDVGLHKLKHSGSVLARTAYGTGWIIGWRIVNRGLGFISTLFLARLLSPSDFGIVALAMGFMHSLNQLSEFGTENAIIRDDKHDRAIYDTGFTINVIRGALVAFLIFLLAAPAAKFFHSPHFEEVVWVAAIVSLLNGFENIGIVDFRRFMAFNYEFKLKIVPRVVSAATAISLAFILHDFWALIIAILVSQVITLAMSYILHPYRPRFTLCAWRRMAAYSIMLWFVNLIGLGGGFGTKAVIGRILGVGPVGVYDLGQEFASLTVTELVGPLSRALFPGFAEIRKNGGNMGEMLTRIIGVMMLVTLPAGLGISLVATPFVLLAFGPRWVEAIPIIEILGITKGLTTFSIASSTVFSVHGWMRTLVGINSTMTIVQLILLFLLLPKYGLVGIAIAIAITEIANLILFFSIATYRLNVSISETILQTWRTVVASAIMTLVLFHGKMGWISPSVFEKESESMLSLHLTQAIAVGGATYISSIIVLWFISGKPKGAESDLLNQVLILIRKKSK